MLAGEFIQRAQIQQKEYHDKETHMLEPLKIRDPVLLYHTAITESWSQKLEKKWDGPYYIQDIKGMTYFLRMKKGSILPKTYHQNLLKIYHGCIQAQCPSLFIEIETQRHTPQDEKQNWESISIVDR